MSRRKAREKVLQALYQLEFQPDLPASLTEELDDEIKNFYDHLLQGVREHQQEIDQQIAPFLKQGWSISRIATIDRAIIRIAMFEMLYDKDTPRKAVINEAVELAKTYGGEESSRFVNGCLGKWFRKQESHLD